MEASGLMVRLVVSTALVVSLTTTSASAENGDDTNDVAAIAAEANVSAVDLQGALNSLMSAGYDVDAATYLASEKPVAVATRTVRVRLTFYVEYGVTASGGHPYAGSTACSWNFAIGTRFRLPDGETFICNDRGLLGSSGWLDLWRRPDLVRAYGPYAAAEVLP